MWQENHGHRRSISIPNAVAVAANDPETIFTRWNIVVISDTTRLSVDPLRVNAIEFKLVTILLRRAETKCGVMELQLAAARCDRQAGGFVGAGKIADHILVRAHFFDENRW